MLGATLRRVKRRLMVPERVEPPNALGARDNAGPEVLFRANLRCGRCCFVQAWVAAMVENMSPQDCHM
jgi:hypothetical protein